MGSNLREALRSGSFVRLTISVSHRFLGNGYEREAQARANDLQAEIKARPLYARVQDATLGSALLFPQRLARRAAELDLVQDLRSRILSFEDLGSQEGQVRRPRITRFGWLPWHTWPPSKLDSARAQTQ